MALWMWPKATNNFSKTQQALEGLALLTACCRQGAARSAIVFHHIYRYIHRAHILPLMIFLAPSPPHNPNL